eukprot:gene15894-9349_t
MVAAAVRVTGRGPDLAGRTVDGLLPPTRQRMREAVESWRDGHAQEPDSLPSAAASGGSGLTPCPPALPQSRQGSGGMV